jgi:EmrB/QacA subfamily drug resistance transporter
VSPRLLAFAGVLIVIFLTSLNLTVVGTALPRIIAELEGFHLYAWAFTSFALSSTVALPIAGKLSDIYGRKVTTLVGIAIFSLASVLGGLAQSMPQLLVFRVLQGLGGGALMAMSWAILGDIFSARERGKYQGLTGAVFGFSSVVGPLVGGLLTDTLGWRWVFFVNVPVALLALYAIARYVPAGERQRHAHVDYVGAALLSLGVVPLLLALTWGGEGLGWTSPLMLLLLGVSGSCLVAFGWWQHRAPDPLLEPTLFRDATFTVANAASFLLGMVLFGAVIYLPLFIQGVQAGSAAASGFALTPLMAGLIASSAVAGFLVSRSGRYKAYILVGLGLCVLASWLISTLDATSGIVAVVVYSVILGLGLGPTSSLYVLAVQNAVPLSKLGVATSANQFFRQIGGTLGVTLFGVIVARATRLEASPAPMLDSPNILTDPAALEMARVHSEGSLPPGAFETAVTSLREALAQGIGTTFVVITAISALALAVTLLLPQRELADDR